MDTLWIPFEYPMDTLWNAVNDLTGRKKPTRITRQGLYALSTLPETQEGRSEAMSASTTCPGDRAPAAT